jgi:SAM-dependent methyltransferase
MSAPSQDTVKSYYDDRVEGKLRDFTDFNPRIEAAVRTLADWAPQRPKRVLEIGCGIGATSWRMARAWPEAEVVGADVSPRSIKVARTCFKLPNLTYFEGFIEPGVIAGKFDLIVLMDVYEHIAAQDRPTLHAAIDSLLADDGRVFISVPTPAFQRFLRSNHPEALQPVDEDVGPDEAIQASSAMGARLAYYREVGVWNYFDYAHIVFVRLKALVPVAMRQPQERKGMRHSIKQFISKCLSTRSGDDEFRSTDVLSPVSTSNFEKFALNSAIRRRQASAWKEDGNE